MNAAAFGGTVKMAGPFNRGFTSSNGSHSFTTAKSIFSTVKDVYEKVLDARRDPYSQGFPQVLNECRVELTPEEINTVAIATQVYEDHPHYAIATGTLLTKLIENAHRAGGQYFHLDLRAIKPIDYLFMDLAENVGSTIVATVAGEVGNNCAWHVQSGSYYVERVGAWYGSNTNPYNNTKKIILCADAAAECCAFASMGGDFYLQTVKGIPGGMLPRKMYVGEILEPCTIINPRDIHTNSSQTQKILAQYDVPVHLMSKTDWDTEWNKATERFRGDLK